jgi:hypothetical protein
VKSAKVWKLIYRALFGPLKQIFLELKKYCRYTVPATITPGCYTHALEVFNATAQKVVNDAILYARIKANNRSSRPENEQEDGFVPYLLD